MPLYSGHPRYITSLPNRSLLVAIPANGRRLITKTFNAANESTESLIARAVQWRDRAWKRLFGTTVPTRSFHQSARETSTTGIPGVRITTKVVRKNGNRYEMPCVIAEVHTIPSKDYERPKGSRSRIFSLNKYELQEAIALASAWRAAMVAGLQQERVSAGIPIRSAVSKKA